MLSRSLSNFALLLLLSWFSTVVYADKNAITLMPEYDMAQYNQEIERYYATIPDSQSEDTILRIVAASQFFMDRPYLLGPLGEGPEGDFDQAPLYRTDVFDCLTYASTVLALAHAKNLDEFQSVIRKVRYQDGQPSFLSRNHFTSIDWNKTNQRNGYIRDITYHIVGHQQQAIAQLAKADISKAAWYAAKPISAIRHRASVTDQKARELKDKLLQSTQNLPDETSEVIYLPLSALFDSEGNSHSSVFNQIPNGAVIEIVRPNWQLKDLIGTNLQISHLGFAIYKDGICYFREASSTQKKVIDIPLDEYLKGYLNSPTVKGINVQEVL